MRHLTEALVLGSLILGGCIAGDSDRSDSSGADDDSANVPDFHLLREFNVYASHDIEHVCSDFQGATGARNDIHLNRMAINQSKQADIKAMSLLAGHDLVARGSHVYSGGAESGANMALVGDAVDGNLRVGGSLSKSSSTAGPTTDIANTSIDHDTVADELSAGSSKLAGLGGVAVSPQGGVATFSGNGGTHAFKMTLSAFNASNVYDLDFPCDSLVIINVTGGGTANSENKTFSLSGGMKPEGVIWNFESADKVDVTGVAVEGTILAPSASMYFWNARVDGDVWVENEYGHSTGESFNSDISCDDPDGQVNLHAFRNTATCE